LSASPPFFWISSSISNTAWFAPPCNGPQSAETPAEIEANNPACDEPTILTVEVEQFCSWSAWRINNLSSALITVGSAEYGPVGNSNIKCRKLSTYGLVLS